MNYATHTNGSWVQFTVTPQQITDTAAALNAQADIDWAAQLETDIANADPPMTQEQADAYRLTPRGGSGDWWVGGDQFHVRNVFNYPIIAANAAGITEYKRDLIRAEQDRRHNKPRKNLNDDTMAYIRLLERKVQFLAGEGPDLGPAQKTRLAALRASSDNIDAVNRKAEALEKIRNLPVDYKDDSHWT